MKFYEALISKYSYNDKDHRWDDHHKNMEEYVR